jgi:hypothetical protein
MASIRLTIVGGVHQRGIAASAGSGFNAYGPPIANLLGSDGCHLDVREAAPHKLVHKNYGAQITSERTRNIMVLLCYSVLISLT